jgi:hypothetical protein
MTRAALVSGFQAQFHHAPDLVNKSIPFRGAFARLLEVVFVGFAMARVDLPASKFVRTQWDAKSKSKR